MSGTSIVRVLDQERIVVSNASIRENTAVLRLREAELKKLVLDWSEPLGVSTIADREVQEQGPGCTEITSSGSKISMMVSPNSGGQILVMITATDGQVLNAEIEVELIG